MRTDTKLEAVRAAMAREDWDTAILLVSRFQRLGSHSKVLRRGREAINNPHLCRQLGLDPKELRNEAIAALKERYSSSWKKLEKARTVPPQKRTKGAR